MLTDDKGEVVLVVEPGRTYTVTISKSGYETVTVESPLVVEDQEVNMSVSLQPNWGLLRVVVRDAVTGFPIPDAEVTISAKLK